MNLRRHCLTLLFVGISSARFLSAQPSPTGEGFKVQSAVVDPTKNELRITLKNDAQKTVTAYTLHTENVFARKAFVEDFFSTVGYDDSSIARGPDGSRATFIGGI